MITDPKKCKTWGQVCLVSAILMNALVLAVNMHLTGLQGELQNKRYEEQYYIINDQTKRAEDEKQSRLQEHSDQLILLRRLAGDRLTPEEKSVLKSNTKELNRQFQASKTNLIALTYLLANDPPEGANINRMFVGKSDSVLLDLQSQFEEQANEYADNLKKQMVQLMDDVSFWQNVHTSTLMFSSIILIIGSILIFRSELVVTSPQT